MASNREQNTDRMSSRMSKHESEESTLVWLGKEIISTLIYVGVILGIFLLIQTFLFAQVSIDGQSMAPTLQPNDRLISNKISSIERFDIVVFDSPDEPDKQYIKRVIGIPGDHVEFTEDQLYLNGEAVDEPYLNEIIDAYPGTYTANFSMVDITGEETVPEGQYFVMGDNRVNSRDSRSFGFISEEAISGETRLQLWPLSEVGFLY
ncbi:signal peptidase I [Dolosigranulum pigrum]|uniref:signal peptidase I n=1 Tax=Dolosigranulum pigrum TaxID=29394 RepID=UPI00248C9858|nr:signal peptidase I [Dolosigranulum pigrum]